MGVTNESTFGTKDCSVQGEIFGFENLMMPFFSSFARKRFDLRVDCFQ